MFIKQKLESMYFKIAESIVFKKEIKKTAFKITGKEKNDIHGIILEAMWRQIPKKVNELEDDDGDDYDGKPIIRHFYGCPSCNRTIYHHIKYCEECGQRLDFTHTWR